MYNISIDKIKAEEKEEKLNSEVKELEATVNNLQGKIDSISNTISNNTDTTSNEISDTNVINSKTENVSHIIINIEDTSASGLSYKTKMIKDEKTIKSLMDIINNAKEYKSKSFIPDFGDIPPTVEVFLANGEKYTITAGDNINDNGNVVNLMTKCYKQDGSDKTLLKLDTKLAEYIENLYKTK